ncbi:BON domain-containing protein [Merismopedia glauca]|uniref:Transporter n=1 Tax=Merismopedia glauca CCAP 1448/3 TaxID=1296344 RepID=A0A2T1C0R7_9CYAN|nr:BON domain-containing protein [Merismopedia glauca]PSB01875.1 transporter [Merismopedia glauca CCAP 1448/3]
MKNLTPILLSGLLTLGVVACDNTAKTSTSAPNSTTDNPTNVDQTEAKTNQDDATSETRRKQLNSDIRAREQRNKAIGDESIKADSDVESEVRSKLEANLPASSLVVNSKEGVVTVTGTVVDNQQLQKIEPLAKEIAGVKSVTIQAKVDPAAKPQAPQSGTGAPLKAHTDKN